MADILGTDSNDILTGTTDPDVITGGAGDDVIDGGFGSDIINGGTGNDDILGAPGNDTLTGGGGSDSLTGGNGTDILNGTDATAAGAGEIDLLTGNGGNDVFILGDADQAYYTAAGSGDYAIITDFNPLQESVQLKGIPNDYALVQNGSDVELYFNGELIAIFQSQDVANLDLDSNTFIYVGSGLDLVGTPGDDVLEGTDGFDILSGGDGNDTITGGEGRDNLSGDGGNDTITGDGGNDNISGGDGNDNINGGDGNDIVDAGIGDDTINGGTGDDNIIAAPGFDTVTGGAGNDTINGGGQNDTLSGTDAIAAGAGEVDALTGGGGNDRFLLGDANQAYYTAAGDADYARITDFGLTGEVIQLHGEASDYSLVQVGADVEIRYNSELIGVLTNRNAADFDLNGPAFEYVLQTNTAPVAVADNLEMDEDTIATVAISDLLSNDSDADGDALSLTDVSNAVNGTVSLDGTGNVVFTPDADFFGAASFDYTITDGSESSTATVNITVNQVPDNTAPTTTGIESFKVTDNAPNTVIDLFAMFDDAQDGAANLTYSLVSNTNSTLFAGVALDGNAGTLTLDYAANASGSTDITLRATDTAGSSVDTTFTVDVFNSTIYGDHIEGSAGDDALFGSWGSDTLLGFDGEDVLYGNVGRDYLDGGADNDVLRGGESSDTLIGGAGDDLLNGTGTWNQGRWEIDVLLGGAGADTFVLGDESDTYYTGGGWLDYAFVKDFNSQEDKLQLKGEAADYYTYNSGSTTYLFQMQTYFWFSVKDVVAVVQGDQVDLNSSAVEFVG